MNELLGWTTQENTNSTALWIKMFATWKYIKGRDVEESVCELVQIQKVFWGFVFFQRLIKSLSLCVSNHIVVSLKGKKYFLNCVPYIRGNALEINISFKRKQNSHSH